MDSMDTADPDGGDEFDRAARALDKALSKAVRILRNVHDWNQDDLAGHTGLSKRTIVRIEGGQSMKLPQMYRISQAFGLSMPQLLAEAEKYRKDE